jgi:hypothetical protein
VNALTLQTVSVTCRVSVTDYSIECESLDTQRIAFRMCSLWEGTIDHDTIAKLNGNF